MADRTRARSFVRTAVVWDVLRGVLDERLADSGRSALDVLDVGGGTGGFAVPLAELGHAVTVVDPSPDALAALERRASEAAVTVRALQGDTTNLLDLAPAGGVDLVLCHGVLEYVEDPQAALDSLIRVVRPDGAISVLAANRNAVVLSRAIAGHLAEARRALVDPDGRWGDRDPVPRRFTPDSLAALLTGGGLRVAAMHGVRVFSDLVPGGIADTDPAAYDALLALETAAAGHPAFQALAAQIHVLAMRPAGA